MIEIIESPQLDSTLKQKCLKLWNDNFDDSEAYVNYYFDNRWRECVVFIDEDKSMIHLNPYTMCIDGQLVDVKYIVGVCTDLKHRKQGHMDRLLRSALKYMYDRKYPFTYLMPANVSIYEPYDFVSIYGVSLWNGKISELYSVDNGKDEVVLRKYSDLDEELASKLTSYINTKLSKEFDCFVKRDEKYLQEHSNEIKACNGNLYSFWKQHDKESTCVGYIAYCNEGKPEIIESILDEIYYNQVMTVLVGELKSTGITDDVNIIIDETHFWHSIDKRQAKQILMARIINLKSFIRILRSDITVEMWVELKDDIILENNGKWHIFIGNDSSYIEQCDEDIDNNKEFVMYTIVEFEAKMFHMLTYYLNEMV